MVDRLGSFGSGVESEAGVLSPGHAREFDPRGSSSRPYEATETTGGRPTIGFDSISVVAAVVTNLLHEGVEGMD